MVQVFISLGSNLGERKNNIRKALEIISSNPEIKLLKVSKNYETKPVGYTKQPDFINAAAEIKTDLSAHELLALFQKIEKSLGRRKVFKWGPRIIDIDILTYGQKVIIEPNLEIPHPLLTQRKFVLEPLAEIAPKKAHPVLKKSYRDLFNKVK
jgi:2-amino-4-hydroxy-6-hydroxymethyldihydropteridine diphosphokinase